MSSHDLPPPRKRSRLGLYAPFALLILLIGLWSAAWIWVRGETRTRMDAGVEMLERAGYEVTWKDRGIGGYPFRVNVTLTEVRVREPSGWGLEAPRLEGQAFMHAPTQWLMATPDGLTFVRPAGGPVKVSGKLIRASLGKLGNVPPNLSFEGVGLAFQPEPGAQPFGLQSAERVELHLREGPDDEGGVFVRVDNGRARLAGLLGRIAGERPVSIVWNATLSKMSAFRGRDWPSAVRNWTAAGGRMSVRQGGVTAGEAMLGSNSGSLYVGSDGRLRGVLDVTLRQAPRALGAMGQTGVIAPDRADAASAVAAAREGTGDVARASINFEAGQTTLGPVALGPAPKVYEAR
jgi:hypothetical protein